LVDQHWQADGAPVATLRSSVGFYIIFSLRRQFYYVIKSFLLEEAGMKYVDENPRSFIPAQTVILPPPHSLNEHNTQNTTFKTGSTYVVYFGLIAA